MRIYADILVLLGSAILALSLHSLAQLVRGSTASRTRHGWQVTMVLVALFIFGYLFFGLAVWQRPAGMEDLIVPLIFFLGAIFVWLTARLSVATVGEVQRVSQLEEQNITDPLTGAYNRRFLDQRLDEEVSKARRYGRALSVMLIDIDDFKLVNDHLGHQVGDQALIGLVDRLGELIRESDLLARYGGDELLIITPETPPEAAALLGERLRSEVEQSKLHIQQGDTPAYELSLTISIGVAGMDLAEARQRPGCSGADLIARADQAVYMAKSGGKNLVIRS